MDPVFLLIPGAFLLAVSLFWLLTYFSHQRIVGEYRLLGDQFGLQVEGAQVKYAGFVRKEPYATGHLNGLEMTVMPLSTGLWETRQSGTSVRLRLPEMKESVKVRILPRGFLTKIAAMRTGFGKEITTGDKAIDEALLIRANHPGLVRSLLKDDGGKQLAAFFRAHKGVMTLQQGILSYDFLGLLSSAGDREKVTGALQVLQDMADRMK